MVCSSCRSCPFRALLRPPPATPPALRECHLGQVGDNTGEEAASDDNSREQLAVFVRVEARVEISRVRARVQGARRVK